jgi:GxxExxY protein
MLDETTSPLTHAIIGAAIEVHTELGPGFLEAVYQESLAVCLRKRGVPFEREASMTIAFQGAPLATHYRADFQVADEVLVELKAIQFLGRNEEAQLLHYLKATGLPIGLLLNFGSPSLQVRRLVYKPRTLKAPEIESV